MGASYQPYQPYFDPEFETLIERIYPPEVCIDNDTDPNCTLVKVDSANKQGILLEMVQILTDLDLVISKSYISSDGGWFMDVFHVTDQLGNKLTDESLRFYIQEALGATRRSADFQREIQKKLKSELNLRYESTEHTALEMTAINQPGLLSEISAVLLELNCDIAAAVAWTHHNRSACLIYVEDGLKGGPITDPKWLAHVKEQLQSVVEARHGEGERRSIRLSEPLPSQTHSERRLHQLMYADRDYEQCCGCESGCRQYWRCNKIHVSVETCKEKDYSVVNVRCRDRPKLLFDTVCALTDLQYIVFHAAVGSKGMIADQEYFIRQKDGRTLNTESDRQQLTQSLIAAVERRSTQGLRLDLHAKNKKGLLADITRVLRENGLSITRAEVSTQKDSAMGSFYVTDTDGQDVSFKTIESVRQEVGRSVLVINKSQPCNNPQASSSNVNGGLEGRRSLGSMLWSQLERISSSFASIRH